MEHVGICIKSLRKSIPDVNISVTKNFDFAAAIESVYPLLDIIFSFLDYRDLKNAAQVKKSWSEVADKILRKRVQPSWFSCFKVKNSNIMRHSDNVNTNNVGIGIILYNSRRIKLNNYICVHKDISSCTINTVAEYFAEELIPQNIEYCFISCPKVISYFPPNYDKSDLTSTSTFDGVIIPKIPNIRTAMFHCNPVKVRDIKSTVASFIKENEEVKCLLMFCKNDLRNSIYNLLDVLLPEGEPQSVAVGGGIIRGTKTFQTLNKHKRIFSQNDVFCVTFIQEKDSKCEFNSFSVVISGDDLSKEEFETELMKFKKNIVLRTNSAAFRICCSDKMETDEELIIFNKVFPNIPLLGMDADGEIGWNSYNNLDSKDWLNYSSDSPGSGQIQSKRLKRSYPIVQHQWSTVLVLITWGSLITK